MSIKDSYFKDDDDDDDNNNNNNNNNNIENTAVSVLTGLRATWFLKARERVSSERYEMNLLSVEGVRDSDPSSVGIGVHGEGGNAVPLPHIFLLKNFFLGYRV